MIGLADRRRAAELIDEAVTAGARQHKVCAILEVSSRTCQRWTQDKSVQGDGRPKARCPALADEGRYLASESTFYRVLRETDQQHHRGRSEAPQRKAPGTHCAPGPNQVWCRDQPVDCLPDHGSLQPEDRDLGGP